MDRGTRRGGFRALRSEKAGWDGNLHSHGELGALLVEGTDREMRRSLRPTGPLSPPWELLPYLTIAGIRLKLKECSDSVLKFKCIFLA